MSVAVLSTLKFVIKKVINLFNSWGLLFSASLNYNVGYKVSFFRSFSFKVTFYIAIKHNSVHIRQRKNLLTSVEIEPTTYGLDLPSLCRLSYKVVQRKSGTILDGESRRIESKGTYECCAA